MAEDHAWNDVVVDVRVIVSSDDLKDAIAKVMKLIEDAPKDGVGVMGWSVQNARFLPNE
jgi:hypothetical protein